MTYFVGVDLGQVSEPTALVVVESNTLPVLRTAELRASNSITYQPVFRGRDGQETTEHPPVSYSLRHLERISPGTAYPAIVERVRGLCGALPKAHLVLDVTGVGKPVSDLFRPAGLSPRLVQVIAGDGVTDEGGVFRVPKRELVSTAQVMLQTARLKIARGLPKANLLVKELVNFRMKVSLGPKEDVPVVWRDGVADDLVLALSIALWLAERETGIPGAIILGSISVFATGPFF